MSSNVFSQQSPSPVQTRRTPTQNENIQNNNNNNNNRRSLSGKFRNLFRKDSSSPNRTTNNLDRQPPPTPVQQQYSSHETMPASTEAHHLRTPLVSWPFGKKKAKSPRNANSTTNGKTKTKANKKTKKTPLSSLEISAPIPQQQFKAPVYNQNITVRTPELGRGTTERIHSSPNYETTTKGFRDYIVIDNTKFPQQVNAPNIDNITPPYPLNNNRSPIVNHSRLPDSRIEYSYTNDTSISPTISETEIFHTPKQRHTVDGTSSLTAAQILAEKIPLRPHSSSFSPSEEYYHVNETPSLTTAQILAEKTPIVSIPVTYSSKPTTPSHQWMSTSSSSLNNATLRSPTNSVNVDAPILNAPSVSLGHLSNIDKSKRPLSQTRFDEPYNSLSKASNAAQRIHSYTNGSMPDAEITYSNSFTSSKPTISNIEKYPGLSAIVHYHLNPNFLHLNERSSKLIDTQRKQRFDASTTTLNEHDLGQEWLITHKNASLSPPLSIHRHDGYIRPLTPQKPSVPKDVTQINVHVDDLHIQSSLTPNRTSYYDSPETPVTYRSSTTIYTKDKHNYLDNGEIRTWSLQDKDDIDSNRKPSTSIHIEHAYNDHENYLPTNTNEYQYNSRKQQEVSNQEEVQEENYIVAYEYGPNNQLKHVYDQRPYSNNRPSQNFNSDTNFNHSRSSGTFERDTTYDRTMHSYENIERKQEPLDGMAPVENTEASLRHYSLKRSNSYDGLGILISADAKTGLSPRIRDVEAGSPGYRAGLRKDDRIIYINGINVENLEFSDVLILVQQNLNNNNLQLTVINDGIIF